MNYLRLSSPLKKGRQIVLSGMLGMAALGNGVASAAGLCVRPSGAGHCFASIQSAVDAANDDARITIWAGKYVEQVTILGKNLTLVGRPGAVIQAPDAMEDTLSPVAYVEARPIILVAEADVTIRDLTVDGANSAASNPFMYGIAFINADGVVRGNVVKNIGFGEPTLPADDYGPSYQGEGIVVVNFGATPRTVTLAENQVINYNSGGITIFAQAIPEDPTLGNLTVNVVNNTVIGSGPNDVIDQWGIFFGGYESAEITGTLKDNQIRDQTTVAPYPLPGIGIAALSTTNVEISDNAIEHVNIGLTVSGTNTQVIENRFKRTETGIILLVEDALYGSAINTLLHDNRFDKVAVDIITGPGATYEATARMEPVQKKRLPR